MKVRRKGKREEEKTEKTEEGKMIEVKRVAEK